MADYGFEHDGKVYTPNGTLDITPEENVRRNAAIAATEMAHWASQPDRMLGYYDTSKGVVTTWNGRKLGVILDYNVYRHNMGHQFISLRMRGTNGATYYGRASYDNGTCINLRKTK